MKEILILLITFTFNIVYSHSPSYNYDVIELSNRLTPGDINDDGVINVQDVILLVNINLQKKLIN